MIGNWSQIKRMANKKQAEEIQNKRLLSYEQMEQYEQIIVDGLFKSKQKMAELRGVQFIGRLIKVDHQKIKQTIEVFPEYRHRLVLVAMKKNLDKKYKVIDTMEVDSMAGKLPATTENIQIGIDRKTGKPSTEEIMVSGQFHMKFKEGTTEFEFVLEVREGDENNTFEYTFYCDEAHAKHAAEFFKHLNELANKHNFYKGQAFDSSLKFLYNERKYTWNDLILDNKTKKNIKENVDNFIELGHVFAANNCDVKRGIILEGSPGTGKTKCGKILMNSYKNTSFIMIPPRHFKEEMFQAIWQIAKEIAPTIIFLEDFDMFGQSRERNFNGASLGDFMQLLDGITDTSANIITIATTNSVGVLEAALKNRPGRFDTVITFPKPAEPERRKMAEMVMGTTKCDKRSTIIEIIVEATSGKTPAYIEEFFKRMVSVAISEGNYDKKTYKVNLTVKCAQKVAEDFGKDSDFDEKPGDREIDEDEYL